MRTSSTRVIVPSCLAALVLVAAAIAMAYGGWTPPFWGLNVDHLAVVGGVVAAGCCVLAAAHGRGRLRASWLLLGAMVALYASGDVLWLIYASASDTLPILSLADSLYLAALVPGALGLIIYPVTRGLRSALGPTLLDAALLACSVILASQVFVFREVVTLTDPGEPFILLIYPVTDLLLASLVLILMLRSVGDTRVDVALLGLTFLTFALADNAYALAYARGEDYAQGLPAVAYVAAPLFLALSALGSITFTTESRFLQRRLPGTWAAVLPDLAALAALGVSVVWWLEDSVTGGLAAAVLVLTGARQLFSTSRAHRWRSELERRIAERTEEVAVITERHRELEAMKYAFLSAVSHELRTPLTAIRGSLELLEDGDGGELTPHGLQVVAIAARGTQRLARIVDDIMDLERFKSGTFAIVPRHLDLGAVLAELSASLGPVARGKGVDLVVSTPGVRAWCDGDRVIQALNNLVSNALKFAPAGTSIVVDAEPVGDEVRVSVRDQGRGIPADQVGRIFERFHQVDPIGDQAKGGAGLGLTITRHIVEAHGGRIWVESVPGAGATFSFTLPLAQPPVVATVAVVAPVSSAARRLLQP